MLCLALSRRPPKKRLLKKKNNMANGNLTVHFSKADRERALFFIERLRNIDKTPEVRRAFNDAMTPLVKQGKTNIKSYNNEADTKLWRSSSKKNNSAEPGELRRSLTKRAYPSKLYAIAGGQRKGAYKGNHLHLVDRGTKQRFKKNGRSTGKMYAGKSSTRWGKLFYMPHGKPGAWTNAFNVTKYSILKRLVDSLDKAVRKGI